MNKHVARGLSLLTALYFSSAIAVPLYDVKVSLDGTADFQSIQEAINHAPDNNLPYVIYINHGTYNEKLEIKRPNIYLIGEDRNKTVITATTANGTFNDQQDKKFGTTGSRTLNIAPPDFSAPSLTFDNRADFPQNQAKNTNKHTLSSWSWVPDITLGKQSTLRGEVIQANMRFPATITIKDSLGKSVTTQTDQHGKYHVSIAGMAPPLLVSADDHSGNSCLKNNQKRSQCSSALVVEINHNKTTIGNINPFSDLVVSTLATHEQIDGPQQLVEQTQIPALSHQIWLEANQNFMHAFQSVVQTYGIDPQKNWNPVNYDLIYQPVMQQLATQVIHNRGYNSSTGLASKTYLTDLEFRPIINLEKVPAYQLDKNQLAQAQKAVKEAEKRIFIVGDSTASNYEADVYPRMGWGQAFAQLVSDGQHLQVINAARSGRSSRDFVNERWLSQLDRFVQPGDYLFIQFSHNDEKCNRAKAKRGPIDVANLCTYPNDQQGHPQYPQGHKSYSFQYSLERYLSFAEKHQLHPVMLTSVPRAKSVNKKNGVPITPKQHITKQNKQNGYLYFGSYTQTVKETAKIHHVPLLDMQTRVIEMANSTTGDEWKNLWLAVDPNQYPYYKGRTGRIEKPDTTHFQKKGAETIAKLVVDEIKANQSLSKLAHYLPQ